MQRRNIIIFTILIITFILFTFLFLNQKNSNQNHNPEVKNDTQETPKTTIEQPTFSKTIDINNDGKDEDIKLFINSDTAFGARINIGEFNKTIPGNNPDNKFSIVDIDAKDQNQEIAITDIGPSSDFTTYFYTLEKDGLQLMGEIPGSVDNMTFAGNGIIATLARGQILDTWFYQVNYKLSKQKILEAVPEKFYTRVTPTDSVTLLKPLKLYSESSKQSKTFTIPADTIGNILGCDNILWCKITINKQTGWFYVKDGIINSEFPMEQVFSGLSFAD